MSGPDLKRHRSWFSSVSRSLQIVAGGLLLLIVAVTVHQLMTIRASIVDDTSRQMARLDMVFAEQTGRAVETVDFILRNVIESYQTQRAQGHLDTAAFDMLLRRRIDGVRQVSQIALTDAAGQIVASSGEGSSGQSRLPPEGLKALAYHVEHPQAALRFSPPFHGADGKWIALLTRPILGPDGSVVGIGVADLSLAYFEDFYRTVELSENGSIVLHLRDGTVLARFPHVDTAIGSNWSNTPPFRDVLSRTIAGTLLMESPVDGSIRVTAIRALRSFPLAVMVSVEEKKLLAGWRQQAWLFAIAACCAGALIVGLLLLLARRSREVEQVVAEYQSAKNIAEHTNVQLREQMDERERAEAALRQAQRIEAVGQLTGGVAHDFNNLLTVLLGNIDLLQRNGALEPRTLNRLAAMRAAAERGATLTGHLLAFARRQPLLPRAVDLNSVVTGMQDLLESALGRRVQMRTRLASDLWPAMVDPTQIELVILNLAINARDAMPDGGLVTIETGNQSVGPTSHIGELPDGDYVAVTVHDLGTGMTPEVLAKAFEPFFSTKRPGAGSGLGLSQVFGTARQSGGDVKITTAVGEGTSVSVYLPRSSALQRAVASPSQPSFSELRSSEARVLVVDDDDTVRGTTAEVLESLGYNVLQAASGEIGLALIEQDATIDLVLTDVAMPGMSGPEFARRIRTSHSHLPIVFISGYADPEGIAGGEPLHRLVRKPFRPADLREQVEEALAETRAPAD